MSALANPAEIIRICAKASIEAVIKPVADEWMLSRFV
jgi:hypothetical protein